jgi:NSS family neurotransmitter:Na+ symporter
MGRDALTEFRKGAGPVGRAVATPWLFGVGVVLPVFLVFTLLTTFGVDGEIGFWPTVVAAVAVAVAAFAGLRGERSLV